MIIIFIFQQINIKYHGEPKVAGTPSPQSYVTPLPLETPTTASTSTTTTTSSTTTTSRTTTTTTTPFGHFQGPTPIPHTGRVGIVKKPKRKKSRRISEEELHNYQPTSRFVFDDFDRLMLSVDR
jgi:hypothetical protein